MGCYVVNTSAEDDSGKRRCAPALEDYYECLHHKKEVGFAPWTCVSPAPQTDRGKLGGEDEGAASGLPEGRDGIRSRRRPYRRRDSEPGTDK